MTERADLSPVRTTSKSGEVFERLRLAIVSRRLAPGASLKEAVLAGQLQVSQMPVREALLKLEGIGLVERVRDKGTRVVELSRAEMVEMIEVRAHLEELAFVLAAGSLTDDVVSRLRAAADEIRAGVSTDDYLAAAEADLSFHRIVWAASGNQALARTLERLCTPIYAFVSQQRRVAGEDLAATTSEHDELIDALMTGDAGAVRAAVRAHINERTALPASALATASHPSGAVKLR